MSLFEFLTLLIIASLSGIAGQRIAGYSFGGWLLSAAIGFVGAVIGKGMAAEFGFRYLLPLTIGGELFPVAWAIIGSVIFSVVFGVLTRKN